MRAVGKHRKLVRRLLVASLVATLLLAGCGGGSSGGGGTEQPTTVVRRAVQRPRAARPPAVPAGLLLFEGHCAVCHALVHPARREEITGPDLRRIRLTAEQVRQKVTHGGPGMPAMGLSQAQIDLLAPYVQKASIRLGHPLPHATASVVRARKLFDERCGMCHALADAHAKGGAGPNFNESPWDATAVRGAVVTGFAFMPTLTLSRSELDTLARYVASVAGRKAVGAGG